jgi:hypothetical protein
MANRRDRILADIRHANRLVGVHSAAKSDTFEVTFDHRCELVDKSALAFAVYEGDVLIWGNELELASIDANAHREIGLLDGRPREKHSYPPSTLLRKPSSTRSRSTTRRSTRRTR